MVNLDNQIIDWLNGQVGTTIKLNDKKSEGLNEKLESIIANGPSGVPQGPPWVTSLDYKKFVQKSEKIISEMTGYKNQIDTRIKQLLTKSSL